MSRGAETTVPPAMDRAAHNPNKGGWSEQTALRLTLALVVAAAIARGWVAATIWLGDAEAFYWCYARHLAGGYLEHPPGIAALIAASTAVLGDAPLAVRLPGILCTSGATLLLAWLAARRSKTWRAGWITAVAVTATPALYAGGLSASPDPPAALAWAAALLLVDDAVTCRRDLSLLGAGLCIGLGFEMKYFMLLALPAVAWLLWSDSRARGLTRRPAFWGGVVLCLAAAAPNVVWNAIHGWPAVLNRIVWQQGAAGFSPLNVVQLLGGQLAYLSPALAVCLLALVPGLLRGGASAPVRADPVLAGFVVPPLVLSWLLAAWTPRAEPHWTLFGMYGLYVAAGEAYLRVGRGWRRAAQVGVAIGAAAIAALHLLVLTPIAVGAFPEPRHDLSNELLGWPVVADRIRGERLPGEPFGSYHYTLCSQLSYAMREDAVCLSHRTDDFDGWGAGSLPVSAASFLFVGDNRYDAEPKELYAADALACVELGAPLAILRGGRTVRTFRFWRCYRDLVMP